MNYGLTVFVALIIIMVWVFIDYERRNTTVKEISLLATMSGLAGVSRVPFAALPNVQPTTFLVIVSGYVFGPRFGFMMGAVATIVSNCFLGHGPWTPWQMAAWGLAGLSAGILKKAARRPSRLVISIFAFLWGFIFDYIMNLWHWLFFVYPLNLKSFIAVYISSFYFDLMHGLGNFIFSYFFAPDIINVLSRFKERISYIEIPYKEID